MIHWQEGLRIVFGKPGCALRINLGRIGYIYWEHDENHGVVTLYRF
jgi:hypothetical protein